MIENQTAAAEPMTQSGKEASTAQQMMRLLQVQALSLNMNNAANAQQNAYTLNTAIIGGICKRILAAGAFKEQANKQ